MFVLTAEDATLLAPALKNAVESLGTRRPVFDIVPLRSYVDASIGDSRFMVLVLAGFAAAAVLLTAIGLYGTLAYLAAFRAPEFGVRMALGATKADVLRAVAGEGLLLAAIGAALGLAGAAVAADAMQALLYGVEPVDTITIGATAATVAVVALAASLQPAWRAASRDPSILLRTEGS
jgi:putative ABC transport system permease protein